VSEAFIVFLQIWFTPVANCFYMRLRLVFLVTNLFWSALLPAQSDTTFLKEVLISGKTDEKFLAGSSVKEADSLLQKVNASRHLGEVLSFQFPIYFRNYGSGMLSGISMRGTSPQHTAVLWNDVNIASFSLGQADFSMLPSAALQSVTIREGAGSARFGSGAFGGTVLLSSDNSPASQISLSQEVASFNRYFSTASMGLKTNKWSSASTLYYLRSKNNFPIQETDTRQSNAAVAFQGLTHSTKYQINSNSSVGVNYWYHYADRQIQPALSIVNSSNEQQDENHRLLVNYEHATSTGMLQVKTGLIDDVIVYNGGRSRVRRWLVQAKQPIALRSQWNIEWSMNANHIIGYIDEYLNGKATENRAELAVAVNRQFKRFSFAANIRQPFIDQLKPPLLVYAGTDIFLFEQNNLGLATRLNVSRNFRTPTLNERYWQNAGDQSLLPEESYAAEAGISLRLFNWKVEPTVFYQSVDQWIQWVPVGNNGNFVPRNIKQVKVKGAELGVSANASLGKVLLTGKASYQYVQSLIAKVQETDVRTIGSQLIYTPQHTVSGIISFSHTGWCWMMAAQGSGERFTDELNSQRYALEPYVLVDGTLSKSFQLGSNILAVFASVKNILNTNYQLYISRAQPGRNYSLQINYQLNYK
jgi:vitamin B12 transporter